MNILKIILLIITFQLCTTAIYAQSETSCDDENRSPTWSLAENIETAPIYREAGSSSEFMVDMIQDSASTKNNAKAKYFHLMGENAVKNIGGTKYFRVCYEATVMVDGVAKSVAKRGYLDKRFIYFPPGTEPDNENYSANTGEVKNVCREIITPKFPGAVPTH
ncbi:MAG: hypothetical protein HOO06_11870 [Bdellovibrionaceae bacterium]|jgi:hypothetical protein|nr:hypothetical protein [Pseudobdellovibrionaceae bacterium]